MSNYDLIALDMDGTLLNSKKELTPRTITAIQKAISLGKTVILNTGRGPAELAQFFGPLDGIQYLNCVSGALVYDRKRRQKIYTKTLEEKTVSEILKLAALEDNMVHFLTDSSIVQTDKLPLMESYQMGIYLDMFRKIAVTWDDLTQQYNANPFPVEKVNIYHTSAESRARTKQRILESGLSVELIDAETTSLEISAEGVDKGNGLEQLCRYLDIPLSQTIVVGDAENDIGALQKAGLAIVMGNAANHIKKFADALVADNDHDGCAEAIEQYFLYPS